METRESESGVMYQHTMVLSLCYQHDTVLFQLACMLFRWVRARINRRRRRQCMCKTWGKRPCKAPTSALVFKPLCLVWCVSYVESEGPFDAPYAFPRQIKGEYHCYLAALSRRRARMAFLLRARPRAIFRHHTCYLFSLFALWSRQTRSVKMEGGHARTQRFPLFSRTFLPLAGLTLSCMEHGGVNLATLVDHPSFFALLTAFFVIGASYDILFFLSICSLVTAAVYFDSPAHRESVGRVSSFS